MQSLNSASKRIEALAHEAAGGQGHTLEEWRLARQMYPDDLEQQITLMDGDEETAGRLRRVWSEVEETMGSFENDES